MRTGRTGPLKPPNLDASKILIRLWPVVSNLTKGQPPKPSTNISAAEDSRATSVRPCA